MTKASLFLQSNNSQLNTHKHWESEHEKHTSNQMYKEKVAIDQYQKLEEKLHCAQKRLQIITENTLDIITIYDNELRCIYCNPSIKSLSDKDPGEFIGKTVWSTNICKNYCQKFENGLRKVFLTRKPVKLSFYLKKKYYHSVFSPEINDKGKVRSVLVSTRDITWLKELEKRKDIFLSTASHELKTPLTSIKGYAQIIEKNIKQKNYQKLVPYVKKQNISIDKLNLIIKDLVELSKIQTGKTKYIYQKTDLNMLIYNTVSKLKPFVNNHRLFISGKVKNYIMADKSRIEQVLVNIIDNAVKYSPKANKVSISAEQKAKKAIVKIQDYGIGIPPYEQTEIFKRFFRTKATVEKYKGMGMGLFICKEIIKNHSGDIWVKSKEHVGSTFYFSIPVIN